jgi:hypothetical protein
MMADDTAADDPAADDTAADDTAADDITADGSEIEDDGLAAFGDVKFYRGVLLKLQRGRQHGIVRTAAGKEIHFEMQHAQLLGDRWRWEDLHEGMPVGYDLGWTSRGLRITAIKPLE